MDYSYLPITESLYIIFCRMTDSLDAPVNKNKKYRKDKPWDTDDIDHWKVEEFKPGDMKSHLLDESSFATLFPKYREKYLQQVLYYV